MKSLASIEDLLTPARAAPESSPTWVGSIVEQALRIADRSAISDIETGAAQAGRTPTGRIIYDVRPMLDTKAHCCDSVRLALDSVLYARDRRLIALADDHMPGRFVVLYREEL